MGFRSFLEQLKFYALTLLDILNLSGVDTVCELPGLQKVEGSEGGACRAGTCGACSEERRTLWRWSVGARSPPTIA
jgi:hypothetical protein